IANHFGAFVPLSARKHALAKLRQNFGIAGIDLESALPRFKSGVEITLAIVDDHQGFLSERRSGGKFSSPLCAVDGALKCIFSGRTPIEIFPVFVEINK